MRTLLLRMSGWLSGRLPAGMVTMVMAGGVYIFLLTGCGPAAPPPTPDQIPTGLTAAASPAITATPTPAHPAQDWDGTTPLIVQSEWAWLRDQPSHLAVDAGMPRLARQTPVRVIGKPIYEVEPGQWWWLVSAEATAGEGAIGWVEAASLGVRE